jgi:hypothetical protein
MNPYLSLKLRRLSLLSMVAVVFVHAFNFEDRYLWFGRLFSEEMDFNTFTQLLISNGLLRFGLPLFFMRAGYLMTWTDEKYQPFERIKKKAKSLLVPYLAWSAFGILITSALESSSFRPFVESSWLGPFGNKRIAELSGWELLETLTLHPISFQLWFLRSLFVLACLFPLLKIGLNRFAWPLLAVSFLMWMLGIGLFIVEGEGLFFFSLGMVLHTRFQDKIMNTSWISKSGIFFLIPIIAIAKTYFSYEPQGLHFLVLMVMYKLLQVCLVLGIWRLYDLIFKGGTKANVLDKLSPYTFFVYGFHVPILYYATDYFHFLWGRTPQTSLAIYFGLPFSIMAFSILFGWILKTIYKPAFLVFTGFRNA